MPLDVPTRLEAAAPGKKHLTPKPPRTPDLEPIDWAGAGLKAPQPQPTPATLPKADVVVVTWADAEWAALDHVFCRSGQSMSYGASGPFPGWVEYSSNMPPGTTKGWNYWGSYALVEVNGTSVLLFKSNTHLDWPGRSQLSALATHLIKEVKPQLLVSAGTSGGTITEDHVGTVRIVSSATLYGKSTKQAKWPVYRDDWTAPTGLLNSAGFAGLLVPVPVGDKDVAAIADQYNQFYGTALTVAELDPNGLNVADASPQIHDQSGGAESLLTAASFVVGTTAGDFADFACIEMDDAILAEACHGTSTRFAAVRNISDPAQNSDLSTTDQSNWGLAIYDAYGIYTSLNGALATWAIVAS